MVNAHDSPEASLDADEGADMDSATESDNHM